MWYQVALDPVLFRVRPFVKRQKARRSHDNHCFWWSFRRSNGTIDVQLHSYVESMISLSEKEMTSTPVIRFTSNSHFLRPITMGVLLTNVYRSAASRCPPSSIAPTQLSTMYPTVVFPPLCVGGSCGGAFRTNGLPPRTHSPG
jgi:hypothetical protein